MTQTTKRKASQTEMNWRIAQFLRRLVIDTTGQELAEAAAVLPLMFMILLGIFWFGEAFSIYGTTARAAQEAALAAAESTCTTCAGGLSNVDNAEATITNVFTVASLNTTTQLSPPSPAPNLLSCLNGTVVSCTHDKLNICVQPNVQLSSTGGGAVGACGVSVSFTYRYQMWLPFTSLNNQAIQIRAAAQAPLESR
jgi:Flp pilus assembly protein TadG